MSKEVARTEAPARRRRGWLPSTNTMSFPRELRDAIPDLPTCVGRVLQLDSTTGAATNTRLLGPMVRLKMVVKETGKLKGQFVIGMELQAEAARALAETLVKLADEVENSR
jgi:hypothetical protein